MNREKEKPVSNLTLLSKILRLKDMKIIHYSFQNRNQVLNLTVKPYKNGCRCPECGRRGRITHRDVRYAGIAGAKTCPMPGA